MSDTPNAGDPSEGWNTPPPTGPPPASPPGYPQQPPSVPQSGYPQQPPPAYGQPAYGQPPYVPQGYGHASGQPKADGMAIGSLIASIVGIPLLCACGVGIIGSIIGVVLGFMSRTKIRQSNGALTGEGLALAGLITGAVGVVLFVLYILLVVVFGTVNVGYQY